MKNRLINLVIDACYRIDKKRGVLEHYEYETAPYCGHHYNETKGVLSLQTRIQPKIQNKKKIN